MSFPALAIATLSAAILAAPLQSAHAQVEMIQPARFGSTSVISTVAGTGEAGDQGDGGPATERSCVSRATLRSPPTAAWRSSIPATIGSASSPDGTITTIAGTGVLARPATAYRLSRQSYSCRTMSPTTGPATSTSPTPTTIWYAVSTSTA